MPSTQQFRKRIKSIQNTRQITKAMEMVASVKMQKAVKSILEARNYVQSSWNMFVKLTRLTLPSNHSLLRPNQVDKTAIIFITSDRGLCGSYNSDLLKKLATVIKEQSNNGAIEQSNVDIIAIGKKGANYVKNYSLGNLVAVFDGFDSNIDFESIIPISKITNGEYLQGKYDKVVVVYSHFVSSLSQTPVVKQILPVNQEHIDLPELWESEEKNIDLEYKFEPNADEILEKLLRRFLRLQIYGAVLEANASQFSAQMVAMKNATDNAKDLIDELTLTYNSVRQASITREIAEIAGAAEAMK
jgi:F-type H+-transporting ATPase subunit gamma